MQKLIIITLFVTTWDSVCWGQDRVEQPLREMTANQQDQVTLQCNYSTTAANAYLFWYKQLPNRSPTFILSDFTFAEGTTEPEFKERFHAKLDSTSKSVPLTIQDVCVSDSAVYYCALKTNTGGVKMIFGTGTKLSVQSEKKEDPVFYKLDNSCLATDFTNHSAVNFIGSSPVRYSGKDYQNYYSSFALREENCPETGGCKEESSGQSRDIERDEKINFISLGLFWLRILFLKTVVFNVLMTFKAWMS